MQGGNIVTDYFRPRDDSYNNHTSRTLEKYGNIRIKALYIRRKPIYKFIQKIIDFASNNISKLQYDKLFHLSLIAELITGELIIIEKNEVINVSKISSIHIQDSEEMKIIVDKHLTINRLLDNAKKHIGDKSFYEYDALKNNCQYFIRYLLKYNNLLTKKREKFLFQDLTKIIQSTPHWTHKGARLATDIAGTINKITGQGNDDEDLLVGGCKNCMNGIICKDLDNYKKKHENEDDDIIIEKWLKTKKGKEYIKIMRDLIE